MDTLLFRKFARMVGNEDDLIPLVNEKYDEAYPDNWDELTPEEQDEWKKAHAVTANVQENKPVQQAQQPATPAPIANTRTVVAQAELPEEVKQLSALVRRVGGVRALETLLLSAATVTSNALQQEEDEKENLIKLIKANSAEFSPEELDEVPVKVLRKMAKAYEAPFVNYGPLGSRFRENDLKDQIAPRPSVLLVNAQEKPA